MKRKNKVVISLVAIAILLGLLAGCGGSASQVSPPPEIEQTQQTTTPPVSQSPAPPSEPPTPLPTEREITDMAGRVMDIPIEIGSVFSANPISAIYLYTLVPDLLLGWNYELNEIERSIILEKYHTIPNFGMGDAINYEAVMLANPSIALNVSAINEGSIDQSDKLAESLGVPVIMVSNLLEDAPAVYRFMGDLFGVREQAEKLAAYAERTFNDISAMSIPDEEKVRIYYGNGEDSLETAPAGSSHGQIIDMVNAINAADLELGDGSRIQISAEQLLAWDPDVILVHGEPRANMSGGTAAAAILSNPNYSTLKAVETGMVFGTPNAPFSWVDRPPGPNRIIGMRWLSTLIYPDYIQYDVDDEVREFFRLFYHTELSDEKLAQVYHGF